MAFEFPSNPTNGQQFGNYYWDAATGAWRNLGSKDALAQRLTALESVPAGLVRVVPTSVSVDSGTATVNSTGVIQVSGAGNLIINNAFTSLFRNYRVVISQGRASAQSQLQLRYASSGVANATNNYWHHGFFGASNSTSGVVASQGVSNSLICSYDASATNHIFGAKIDILNPTESQITTALIQSSSYVNATLGFVGYQHSSAFNSFNSFDGLVLRAGTGTFSARVQVYGYRD